MSHTNCLYHIVFSTYHRANTITHANRESLYRFLWSLITKRKSKLLRINGKPNHIHILADIHPSLSLAELIAELKRESSKWMKTSGLFPCFEGWGKEYFATSKSISDKHIVIEYIKNQVEHHRFHTFEEEMSKLFHDNGWNWDDRPLS